MAGIELRPADPDDLPRLAVMMGASFMDDPISRWLFPDEIDRSKRHPMFFEVFLDLVIKHGTVMTTTCLSGAALWLDVEPDTTEPADDDTAERLAVVCGPNFERFRALDNQMKANHPEAAHAYLPFIGVAPDRQGEGVGAALLTRTLDELDGIGRPAYLEASSIRSSRLYERLGFARLPQDIPLPNGPSLYPMWREPRRTGD
jgi:GNAT superfamily N-acetyltransferase